jgi:hypothetical protein
MLPIGHIAYAWATAAWLESHGYARDIDYRAAAIAALLPDIVDKPLSLTILSESGTSQGPAHTLVGQALLATAIVYADPKWLPYALISGSHLITDQMWKYPRTLLFPFSGKLDSWQYMGSPTAMLSAYAQIVRRPSIIAIELAGLGLLAWMMYRGRLWRRASLKRMLNRGKLDLDDQE